MFILRGESTNPSGKKSNKTFNMIGSTHPDPVLAAGLFFTLKTAAVLLDK